MSGPGLLVVGEVITDVVARYTGPLAPGTDTAARSALLPGGSGANVACWAARSGARATLLAKVGADGGDWHRLALARAGVRAELRTDATAPTGVVIALVDTSTERTMLTDGGATAGLSPADWDDALLADAGRLHISGYLFFAEPSRSLARLAVERARAAGVAVSVDPASAGFLREVGVEDFLDALGEVDVLMPNRDEALLLTGERDPVEAARQLCLRRHARTAAVTLGADGALICTRDRPKPEGPQEAHEEEHGEERGEGHQEGRLEAPVEARSSGARADTAAGAGAEGGVTVRRIPARTAEPVDSTGAGDAFGGAFLAALLDGADPLHAADRGCAAGALAVARTGARPEPARGRATERPPG